MNCSYHLEREAVGVCMDCGKGICEFCKTIIHNKFYCPNCVEKVATKHEQIQKPIASVQTATGGLSINTNQDNDKTTKFARLSMICSIIGSLCFVAGIPMAFIMALLIAGDTEPHFSIVYIVIGLIIVLDFFAIFFGKIALGRKLTLVQHKNVKAGLTAVVINLVLVISLTILMHIPP